MCAITMWGGAAAGAVGGRSLTGFSAGTGRFRTVIQDYMNFGISQ